MAGPRVRPALGQVTMTARNPACRPALHATRRPRPPRPLSPRSDHRGTMARVGLRGGGSPRAHASRCLRTAEGSSADPPQPRVPGCAAPKAGGGCAGTRARRASGPALQRRRLPPAPAPRRAVHPPTGPPPTPSPCRPDLPPGRTTTTAPTRLPHTFTPPMEARLPSLPIWLVAAPWGLGGDAQGSQKSEASTAPKPPARLAAMGLGLNEPHAPATTGAAPTSLSPQTLPGPLGAYLRGPHIQGLQVSCPQLCEEGLLWTPGPRASHKNRPEELMNRPTKHAGSQRFIVLVK
ncbi:wiskott-Aldrich syndrome protein homolog 1-like [Cervus canadensis]|uniref:wiskott-Aldrich syndrome protein homolog 1-like n=1 Tax=Cervus canadensis TaxID=1574408 RepID=UPI001CA37247|nr:wiskott-Aldrich syndrome protein homolog 1-like [Cervus canadensis]